MKIGIIQGTTQADKNTMLYECTKRAVAKYRHEVINFGVTAQEFMNKVLSKKDVVRYIMENSKEESLVKYLANYGK